MVILDECHYLNPKRLGSMYASFFVGMGNPKVFGLSATIYRLTPQYVRYPNGFVDTITTIKLINRVRPAFWHRLIFNINVGEMIEQGYLCPLQYHHIPLVEQEQMKLNQSHSDFDLDAFQKQIESQDDQILKVLNGCRDNFNSTIVFCPTVDQAEQLADKVEGAEVVSAKTKTKERKRIIDGFKKGEIKMVMNVGVLTTGFDHPALDAIVLLRPTRSIGLLYQMVGRGLRNAPGKTHCTIVDMTDTIKKVGRIESFKIEKVEGKWNLTTEKREAGWHGVTLYSFTIQR